VMYDDLRTGAGRMFYVPFSQRYAEGDYEFAVRTAGDPRALVRDIPGVIAEVAPTLPLLGLDTMSRQVDLRAANEGLLATVSTVLGALALILAGIGVYGTVAYTVARRTPEIGLRVAVGATHRNVLWLVARGSLAVVAIGVVAGIALALVSSDALTSVLFGLERTDPRVYATAAAVLFAVGAIATIPPVMRALRIDPVTALRYE
jgi:ABC-type antimicrobial peptide transport system permease subunit